MIAVQPNLVGFQNNYSVLVPIVSFVHLHLLEVIKRIHYKNITFNTFTSWKTTKLKYCVRFGLDKKLI